MKNSENSAILKQEAPEDQLMAVPVPHACAQPYHAGSGSYRQLFRPIGAQQLEKGKPMSQKNPLLQAEGSAEQSIKCQLHKTHVGAVGWEPHSSSPTTCEGKADHGFGVCVPLALICLLKIVKSRLYAANFSRY